MQTWKSIPAVALQATLKRFSKKEAETIIYSDACVKARRYLNEVFW